MESIADNAGSTDARPPPDEITAAVLEVAVPLGRLLELIISRASAQAAGVSAPLMERQRSQDRRLDGQATKIQEMHLRLDERAKQIDEQEARIRVLEEKAREVGGA